MTRALDLPSSKLKTLLRNDFIRHNAIFFVGSMVVAAANYLYYPIVGRLLSTSQFGEVQALMSIFAQASLILSVLANVVVNVVANTENADERNKIVFEFGRFATAAMAILVVLALLLVQPLKHFLNFHETWPFVILGLALIVNSVFAMRGAFLRGVNAFGRLSVANLIAAMFKIFLAVGLVFVGFGTSGAIGGLVTAQLLALFFIINTARKMGLSKPANQRLLQLPDFKLLKPELPYATLVFIVSIVTTIFFSIDTILAKHYFSAHDAGLYAGIATIGRIIYFLTGSFATVLLSAVQLKAPTATNRRLILRSLLLTSVLGGSALVAFSVAPHFFIQLLLGQRYTEYATLLPWLSLTLFLISIANLIFLYDLALRRWSVAVVSTLGLLLTLLLVITHHATPKSMVQSLLIGAICLILLRLLDSLRRNVFKWTLRPAMHGNV